MTASVRDGGRRDLIALGATVAALAAWNIGRTVAVPGDIHLPLNIAMAVVFGTLGFAGGLDLSGLGLARTRLPAGLAYGGAVFGVVLVGLLVIGLVPSTNAHLHDDRVQIDAPGMWFQVLVAIPLGTVLLEELAFRGTLLGLLRGRWGTGVAIAASSGLFGLWHIAGVISGSEASTAMGTALAAAGTVVATTFAGVGFAWLRVRSDSLIAPMLAHIATNSLTFAAAWLVSH